MFNKKLKYHQSQSGFSLIELLITLIIGAVILVSISKIFIHYAGLLNRNSRVMEIEHQLHDIQTAIALSFETLPGKDIGYYSGTASSSFIIPTLPANGTIITGSTTQPVPLGLVTPYKVNGYDAFTVLYTNRDNPRLELVDEIQDVGKALVHATGSIQFPSNPRQGIKAVSPGDLYLVIGTTTPNSNLLSGRLSAYSRVMRCTTAAKSVLAGNPARTVAEIQFDFCENGACGTANNYPYLQNMAANKIVKKFGAGSTLVPVEIVTFYIDKSQSRLRLVRNEGGSIVPIQNGLNITWEIIGGQNSYLGELDDFSVNYILRNGSKLPTPNDPLAATFINPSNSQNQATAIEVTVTKEISSNLGNENLKRSVSSQYQILARNLE